MLSALAFELWPRKFEAEVSQLLPQRLCQDHWRVPQNRLPSHYLYIPTKHLSLRLLVSQLVSNFCFDFEGCGLRTRLRTWLLRSRRPRGPHGCHRAGWKRWKAWTLEVLKCWRCWSVLKCSSGQCSSAGDHKKTLKNLQESCYKSLRTMSYLDLYRAWRRFHWSPHNVSGKVSCRRHQPPWNNEISSIV